MEKCKIDDCDNNKIFARGLCRKHYMEQRLKNNPKKCKVESCNDFVKAKGLCCRHYRQYSVQGYISDRTRHDKNNITIEGNIAYIDIYNNQGILNNKAIIDIDDIEKVKNIKWNYAGYGSVYNTKEIITLGEAILGKCKRGYVIAHKNNDMLDYRKCNLVITKTNRTDKNFKHNTSGRKGVYKLNIKGKFSGYYVAYITVNRKSIYLGKRTDFEEAVKLREAAEKEYGWHKSNN